MQDEITKHTKKIYDTVKNQKHTFGEKVKEVIIEIFIIVFAVTLSIWLHNWSEHKHEQKVGDDFLKGLKEDLTKDLNILEENKRTATNLDSNYIFLSGITASPKVDEQLSVAIHKHLTYSLTSTHLNIARYDGFKSSGKIETIENDSLKEKILVFYQQTIPHVTDLEGFLNTWQLKILDLDIDKNNKQPIRDFVTSDKMKGLLELGSHNFEVVAGYYEEAIKQAKEIISEINKI